jgi:hypothetical protein
MNCGSVALPHWRLDSIDDDHARAAARKATLASPFRLVFQRMALVLAFRGTSPRRFPFPLPTSTTSDRPRPRGANATSSCFGSFGAVATPEATACLPSFARAHLAHGQMLARQARRSRATAFRRAGSCAGSRAWTRASLKG